MPFLGTGGNTRIVKSLYFLNPKFQSSMFRGCTARYVSDEVRNPEDWFSYNEAHLILCIVTQHIDKQTAVDHRGHFT